MKRCDLAYGKAREGYGKSRDAVMEECEILLIKYFMGIPLDTQHTGLGLESHGPKSAKK